MTPLESNNFQDFLDHITNEVEPPIPYTIEVTDKTILIPISPTDPYSTGDEELIQYVLTKLELTTWGNKKTTYPESTLFITADAYGHYIRWIAITGAGDFLATDESWNFPRS